MCLIHSVLDNYFIFVIFERKSMTELKLLVGLYKDSTLAMSFRNFIMLCDYFSCAITIIFIKVEVLLMRNIN